MAKPKRPKLLKKPKKGKAKSIHAMEGYLKRVSETDRKNKAKESKYKSDLKKWESLRNRIARV